MTANQDPPSDAASRLVRDLPEFEARLRETFVAGEVTRPARLAEAPRAWWRAPRMAWFALPAGAAIAAAAVIAVVHLNDAPRWELATPSDRAYLAGMVVGGRAVTRDDAGSLDGMIAKGGHIIMPAMAAATLRAPGELSVQLLPGTEITLPPPPRRWFGRTRNAAITKGEIRVATENGFHGARLYVATPDLRVRITGTAVAIMRPYWGTCVCVLEGTIQVTLGSAAPEAVPAGHRFTYYHDAARVDRGTVLPEERIGLHALQSFCVPGMMSGEAPPASK